MDFQSGAELGPYRLIKRLGAGGMGEVWEAEDPRLGRTVAIKILPPSVAENNESKARLTREARTAAQLYHPNIATIHSIEQANDRSFIVMEFVTGETLGDIMRRGPMEEARVCAIGKKVADALVEAHAHGIIHRDIKPDNIVVSGDRVKVLDFGIAKQIGLEGITPNDPTAFVTQAGMIVGTVHYMSPEQALGKSLDARSDIFSLGVVLYQALTGRLPFEGETVTETITRIVRDDPAPIRTINPRVSESMAAIIATCLDKNRDLRFATAADLATALDLQSGVAPTRPYTAPGVAAPVLARPAPSSTPAPSRPPTPAPLRPTVRGGPAAPTMRSAQARRKKAPVALLLAILVVLLAVGALAWHFRAGSATQQNASVAGATVRIPTATASPAATPAIETSATAESTAKSAPASTVVDVTGGKPASQPAAGSTATTTSATSAATSTDQEYSEGLRLMQRGDGEGALTHFRSALAIDPHAAPARLKAAQIELLRHRLPLASMAFRQTLRDGDRLDAHDRLLAEAGLAVSEREADRAEPLIEELSTTYPHDLQVRTLESELQWIKDKGLIQSRIGRRRHGL